MLTMGSGTAVAELKYSLQLPFYLSSVEIEFDLSLIGQSEFSSAMSKFSSMSGICHALTMPLS